MTASKPIIFSGPMVQAILSGNKTQTRRILRKQPQWVAYPNVPFSTPDANPIGIIPCPYGQIGSALWVREAWAYVQTEHHPTGIRQPGVSWMCAIHRTGWSGTSPKWRPSIHMPRWASRIALEVTRIRVQRLQEISAEDAIAEGIVPLSLQAGEPGAWWTADPAAGPELHARSPYEAYRLLWEKIHGDGSWDFNHWVWVVEFRRAA